MSLRTYISNDIEKLVNKLAENIESGKQDIYYSEKIIVQTEGMGRWISIKTAEKNGIFSNFEFFSPGDLLFQLFRLAKITDVDLYNTGNLKWIIFNILGTESFQEKFNTTYHYYKQDQIKQLQLATKLADLFDQYSIYRPEFIRSWNENKAATVKKSFIYHEKWQRWIWRKIKDFFGDNAYDKVEMRDYLIDKLKNDSNFIENVKIKFPHISFFGFSVFTPFHLEIFLEYLNNITDVDFYLFNPAPEEFWLHDIPEKSKVKIERFFGDTAEKLKLVSGNKLLMNLGKTAKDFYLMLFENDSFINTLDNESLISPPVPTDLLHTLQYDIYYNIPENKRKPIPQKYINDDSLEIVSNYSPVREVEALYNYLLKQIENHGYKPQEILVQTTNIDLYTPYIKAVFDNANIKIPYTIADRSFSGTDNMIGILKQILSIHADEFTSENVVQLLEFEEVRRKFDIRNIKLIRQLVEIANIRHGIYGNMNNDTIYVSWKYGLEKILLGYAIKSDELYTPPDKNYGLYPLDFIESEYASEGLKLIAFVDTLIDFLEKRKKHRTLSEWQLFIRQEIEILMEIPEKKQSELNYIYQKLALSGIITDKITEEFSYEVFSKAFMDSLFANTRKGSFISGNITFSSMIPMRSIPYKVVAILGLNMNDFPRKNTEYSFDLITSMHKPGDRNIKETDKYLFFESLLSTKEKLYLSYIGQNIKDTSEIPPSQVIDDILSYITANSDIEKEIIKHPLHNFNSKYFDADFPLYYTYLNTESNNKIDFLQSEPEKPKEQSKYISPTQLLSFFKHPVKWYFNNVLKIYYKEETVLLQETEKFEIENFDKYYLKNLLVKSSENTIPEEIIRKEIIRGNMPLKNISGVLVDKLRKEVEEIALKYREITQNIPEETFDIQIELSSGHIIRGEIANIYGDSLVLLNFSSKNKLIEQIQLYRWMSAAAGLHIENFYIISKDNKLDIALEKCDKDIAYRKLENIIKYYKKGMENILPFNPVASFEYYKAHISKKYKKNPFEKFMYVIKPPRYLRGEKPYIDPYFKRLIETQYLEKYRDMEIDDDNIMYILANLFFEEISL